MTRLDRFVERFYPYAGILAVSMSASLSWCSQWQFRAIGYVGMLVMVYLTVDMLRMAKRHYAETQKMRDRYREEGEKAWARCLENSLRTTERINAHKAWVMGQIEKARKGEENQQ